MHIAEKRIEIRAPVARVFDLFSDFESFPRWMENIREVRRTGRRFTRWAAEAPLGTEVEWEAEIVGYEPDRRIAWRSVRGDIDTEGEVFFEETRRGTTLMHVVLGYALPAGRLGEMVARLFGRDPEHQLADDLERFAAVVETHTPRSAVRERRESRERDLENRRRPEPPRAPRAVPPQRRPPEAEERRGPRFEPRQTDAARERRERDYYAPPRQRRPTHHEEEELPIWEHRARLEAHTESSRRNHLRSPRRSAQEERERREPEERYEDEDNRHQRTRRYALTPREREREREE
ncbi:MAG TPA: SRPBCC family protein, partial [Pyrinomonadaceae bacterium]